MNRRFTLLLGSLLLASAAFAQAPDPGQPAGSFYETATVQARPLSSATGSVTVIGREEIEASGALTVAELLRSAPGITITTNGTRGGLTTASIRGGDPNFTLVLLDGVPLNDPVYQEGDVFDLEGLPAEGVERIEIVRGPLSSFYGSTGLAGVVQIFTREGQSGKTGVQAEVSGGNASFRKGTATVSGGLGRAGWAVTAFREQEAERVARERFEQTGGLASLSVPIGAARLSLKARGTAWEGDDYPDASGGPVYGTGELRHADHDELSLSTGLSFGERHELTATVYRHGMDRQSPAVFPLVPASTEETRFTRTRVGWSSVLRTFQGGRWSAGVDAQRESGRNDSLLLLPPEFGGPVAGDYDISRTVAGAYTELIADRGAWTYELGSRIDVPESDHRRGTQWSPRLGIGWRPVDAVRLHASAGRAWKLPSFFALASPPALGGNPDLRPETVVGGDLGADWRLAQGRVETGLTLFYNRFQDLVDFDFESFKHVNRSEVETRGVEAALGWHPGERLSIQASATWQDFEDLVTHARLRHRPEWTGGVRVHWKPAPALTLDADAQAVSRFFDEQLPVPGRDTVEEHELVGLGAAWRFSTPWELRLRVDNLLGEEYETLIGFPGPDRSVRVGLRWKV
jgi:vitamin B12 transporter